MFELELAWKHLRKDGVVVIDDSNASRAVWDFAENHKVEPFLLRRDNIHPDSMAILVK